MRTINETHHFTRDQLIAMAKQSAKLSIIGGIYVGHIGEQSAVLNEDGSVTVVTCHTPSSFAELKGQ